MGGILQEVKVKLVFEEWVDANYKGRAEKDLRCRSSIMCEVMKRELNQTGMRYGAGDVGKHRPRRTSHALQNRLTRVDFNEKDKDPLIGTMSGLYLETITLAVVWRLNWRRRMPVTTVIQEGTDERELRQ